MSLLDLLSNKSRRLVRWLYRLSTVRRLITKIQIISITLTSLMYNSHADWDYVLDTLLEPLYWFVDNFTKTFGKVLVMLVIFLLSLFVFIAYVVGLPFWWERNLIITIIALLIGNYLLINTIFHYYMAYHTCPGWLEIGSFESKNVGMSVCRKCILPRPPRAHHCSVCDRCILKMDHHCPWLNGCIGHFNHRYFFMFCAFTWLGALFVALFGGPIALEHYFEITLVSKTSDSSSSSSSSFMHQSNDSWLMSAVHRKLIHLETILCAAVLVMVGILLLWHGWLISCGSTSIEGHITKKENVRTQGAYINAYDFGLIENWRIFLGLNQPKITIWHILLPSNHLPSEDGFHWKTVFDKEHP